MLAAQQEHCRPVVGAFGLSSGIIADVTFYDEQDCSSAGEQLERLQPHLILSSRMTTTAETIRCRNHDERERMVLEAFDLCFCSTKKECALLLESRASRRLNAGQLPVFSTNKDSEGASATRTGTGTAHSTGTDFDTDTDTQTLSDAHSVRTETRAQHKVLGAFKLTGFFVCQLSSSSSSSSSACDLIT